jgi:hypothetical protein
MSTKTRAAALASAGYVSGLIVAAAWAASPAVRRATAQVPIPAAGEPRYQISAWAETGVHGAYAIDSRTGEVYLIAGDAPPKSIGSVGRGEPPLDLKPLPPATEPPRDLKPLPRKEARLEADPIPMGTEPPLEADPIPR